MTRTPRGTVALAIAAAVVTIGLKSGAYLLTGSIGLFSDALESGVNLVAAITAWLSLRYAERPADPSHAYGHEKIEFFSSGLEGALIIAAGIGTAIYAVNQFARPLPLAELNLGAAIALLAAAVNAGTGWALLRAAKAHDSPVLQGAGLHLLTDVWTSLGVVGGLAAVEVTGYPRCDAVLAMLVGLHIVRAGARLVRQSFNGLMDHALGDDEQEQIRGAIRDFLPDGATFHHLRTRRAGRRRMADFHLLVPGSLSVADAHSLAHRVEGQVCGAVPGLELTIHVEPIEDAASWESAELAQLGEPTDPPEGL